MAKAVIGISASEVTIQSGPFMGEPRTYVNAAYVDSVLKNGGIPLVIPFTAGGSEMAFKQLDLVDGLILSGGHDLDPHLYGEEIDQKSGETWPDRDAFDMALLKRAEETGKPVWASAGAPRSSTWPTAAACGRTCLCGQATL